MELWWAVKSHNERERERVLSEFVMTISSKSNNNKLTSFDGVPVGTPVGLEEGDPDGAFEGD